MICNECETIARDLREVMAAIRSVAESTRPQVSRVVEALRGGNEDAPILVEELFYKRETQMASMGSQRLIRLMNQKFAHERKTGHRVSLS